MPISKRLRYEVLRRDGHRCRYCGVSAPDARITVDHVVPVTLGGTDDASNLVAACAECNAGKSSSAPDAPIVQGVADDALRWAAAMREAAEIQAADRERRDAYVDQFDAKWNEWYRIYPVTPEGETPPPIQRPGTWRKSIGRFFELGLEVELVVDAVDTAMDRGQGDFGEFKYLCGICWSIIKDRQEIARAMIDTQEDSDG